jgi:hypothetical protein
MADPLIVFFLFFFIFMLFLSSQCILISIFFCHSIMAGSVWAVISLVQ